MLFEKTRPERFAFGIGQFAGNDALDPGAGAVLRKRRLWGNRATSPLYWVIVGAAAAVVAGVVLFVGSDREELPGYGVAVGLYILGWAAFGSLPALWLLHGLQVGPLNEPLGGALPALVSAGIAAAFVGGHIIVALPALTLALTAAPRVISHPRALWAKLTRRHQTPALTDDERRIAEAYDDEWQLADRARNRRFPRPG